MIPSSNTSSPSFLLYHLNKKGDGRDIKVFKLFQQPKKAFKYQSKFQFLNKSNQKICDGSSKHVICIEKRKASVAFTSRIN